MTELSSIVDKFGVYIYKSPLIEHLIENFKMWKHREITMLKDPHANAFICKLDEEIFSDNPIFTPNILEGILLKEWIDEGWIDLLITMFNTARTHRWCMVKIYDREPFWRVFTWREMVKIKYNKYDVPISADVKWTSDLPGTDAAEQKEHKEHLSFNKDTEKTEKFDSLFVTFGNPAGKELGMCDLEPIWDLLIYARYQLLDIINNSAKTSGFYHIIYGDAITSAQTTDLKKAFDYTGVGQAIGAKARVIEAIEFHTPDHPEFTIEALKQTINVLAGVCRLPYSFFMGEKEGGGVFNEGFTDESSTTNKKKYIFGQFKKYIIQLVKMRWGKDVTEVICADEQQAEEDKEAQAEAEQMFKSDNLSEDKGNKDKNNKKEMNSKNA